MLLQFQKSQRNHDKIHTLNTKKKHEKSFRNIKNSNMKFFFSENKKLFEHQNKM